MESISCNPIKRPINQELISTKQWYCQFYGFSVKSHLKSNFVIVTRAKQQVTIENSRWISPELKAAFTFLVHQLLDLTQTYHSHERHLRIEPAKSKQSTRKKQAAQDNAKIEIRKSFKSIIFKWSREVYICWLFVTDQACCNNNS